MSAFPRSGRGKFFFCLLSLAGFGMTFFLGLLAERERERGMERAIRAHLTYALRWKDDLGVMDWAKSLDGSPALRAFRFSIHGKPFVSGGNQEELPSFSSATRSWVQEGWPGVFRDRFDLPDGSQGDLLLAFDTPPYLWASASSTALFILAAWMIAVRALSPVGSKENGPRSSQDGSNRPPPDRGTPSRTPVPPNVLVLDLHYQVLDFGSQVPDILVKDPEILAKTHLLELRPDPSLLDRIQKKDGMGPWPFSTEYPGWVVSLEFTEDRISVLFQSRDAGKSLKKP